MKDIAHIAQQHGVPIDGLCQALTIPRASYYRHQQSTDKPKSPAVPPNKLSASEVDQVLDLLHSEQFIDKTPYDVYYHYLDKGQYYCSVKTMYRLLAERGETQPRRAQRNHRNAIKPELVADQPNQVWSWDITKLLSIHRLVYYYLYVILDIYSRYVVGWLIADRECQHLAHQLIHQSALKQGIQAGQLTLHADNGASMKSHTVAELLEHLGILKTHNRPYTSNDNPFSEAQFKTMKYCPAFPIRFESLTHGEAFCQPFFKWYNQEHYHSGIAWLTPQCVHHGQAELILAKRHQSLLQAYAEKPCRFARKPVLATVKPAYINPPQKIIISDGQAGKNMA